MIETHSASCLVGPGGIARQNTQGHLAGASSNAILGHSGAFC